MIAAIVRRLLRLRILLPLLFLLLVQPIHAQQDPPLSLHQYQEWLEEGLSLIVAGDRAAALTHLRRPPAVELSSGEELRPLALSTEDPTLTPRLELVIKQIQGYDPEESQRRIALFERIASSFTMEQPTLLQRILEWIEAFLDRILPDISFRNSPAANAIADAVGWILAMIGLAVLIGLIGYWLSGSLGGLLSDRALRRRGETALPTARAARHQAGALAEAGDYRQALRQLFLAALLHLHERGTLRYEEHRTNRELLAQAESSPALYQALSPVVSTFEPYWYGIRQPDREIFERYRDQVDHLMRPASQNDETSRDE